LAHSSRSLPEELVILGEAKNPRIAFALAFVCSLSPNPRNRHFDRSASQFHREARSGEIRFSTSIVVRRTTAEACGITTTKARATAGPSTAVFTNYAMNGPPGIGGFERQGTAQGWC
jgi:hypothetical protein